MPCSMDFNAPCGVARAAPTTNVNDDESNHTTNRKTKTTTPRRSCQPNPKHQHDEKRTDKLVAGRAVVRDAATADENDDGENDDTNN